MTDFDFSKWWFFFKSSFIDVADFFLGDIFSPISDILFSSEMVVFTAFSVACAAVSAVVYIILNSRSDNFDDGYLNSRISTPDMYNSFPTDITMFGYSGYKHYRKHKNKKEAEEFFKNNPSFFYITKDGFKFFSKDWNKKKFGSSSNNKYKSMERYYFSTNKSTNNTSNYREKNIDVSAD